MTDEVIRYVQGIDQTALSEPKIHDIKYTPPEVEGIPWPPGILGAIAGFIYESSHRPVKEVAIVTALGLMAGITGKAYNIGHTGLNLYLILIARSAIGKEAMHTGVGYILRSRCGKSVEPFVDFTDYQSAQALIKCLDAKSSMVNVAGEWGRKLQRMADEISTGRMQQLRTAMTNLYQKSGVSSIVGGLAESCAAYSMMGETTPGTFYDSLTKSMIEDGFLSRFSIIEYTGDRPRLNKHPLIVFPDDLCTALDDIASHSYAIINSPRFTAVPVKVSKKAEKILDDFDELSDEHINQADDDEAVRQVWNRAHLKALRISAIMAVCDGYIAPCIQPEHARWAVQLVHGDADALLKKLKGGGIAVNRLNIIKSLTTDYFAAVPQKGYRVPPDMYKDRLIPKTYYHYRICSKKAFTRHPKGSAVALIESLADAVEVGHLVQVSKEELKKYGRGGKWYRLNTNAD